MDKLQAKVQTALAPYLDSIRDCIRSAWDEYQDHFRTFNGILSSRTRASAIRDFIMERVQQAFSSDSMVHVENIRGMLLLVIGTNPEISLRFKKLNRKLLTSNSRTVQALNYSKQLSIPGLLPETVYLNAGYQLNDTDTDIECFVTYPNGERQIAWYVHLPSKSGSEPIVSVPSVAEEPIAKRVRPKVIAIREGQK